MATWGKHSSQSVSNMDGDKDGNEDGVIEGGDDKEGVWLRDGIADGGRISGSENTVVSLDPKSPPSAINLPFDVVTL